MLKQYWLLGGAEYFALRNVLVFLDAEHENTSFTIERMIHIKQIFSIVRAIQI